MLAYQFKLRPLTSAGYLKRAQPMFCKRMRHAALGYHGISRYRQALGGHLGGMHTQREPVS